MLFIFFFILILTFQTYYFLWVIQVLSTIL